MATMINTLALSRDLRKAGLASEQADAFAEALNTHIQDGVATKADLAGVEASLKLAIQSSENKILLWAFTLIIIQGGAVVALIKLL